MEKETNLVYGKNPVIEAINAKKALRVFLVSNFNDQKILNLIKSNKIAISTVSPNEMDKMSNNGVHQGIAAELNRELETVRDELTAFNATHKIDYELPEGIL